MAVEDFDLLDNLMIAGGLLSSGGSPVSASVPYPERFTALTAFEQCVAVAAAALAGHSRGRLRRGFCGRGQAMGSKLR
jgi:hypothetical protein